MKTNECTSHPKDRGLGLFFILAIALLVIANISIAQSDENIANPIVDDYEYITYGDYTATIMGYSEEGTHPTEVVVPDTIEYPKGSGDIYKVVRIGTDSFTDETAITSVRIGKNVHVIGDSAFLGCTGITSLTLTDNITIIEAKAFKNCSQITGTITLNGIEQIEENAFTSTSITGLVIGKNATYIGEKAFDKCPITSIVINSTYIKETNGALADIQSDGIDVVFGDEVEHITSKMFMENTSLKSLTIGKNVTHIGTMAFMGCTGLTTLDIGEKIAIIDAYAFNSCTGLTSINFNAKTITKFEGYVFTGAGADGLTVTIGDDVTIIPTYMFDGNIKLSTLTIGKNVEEINYKAFRSCSGLTSINFNAKNAFVYDDAFQNIGSESSPLEIIFGDEVETIAEVCFTNCDKITSLIFGEKISMVKDRAFDGCTSVSYIEINAKQMQIGTLAFNNVGANADTLEIVVGDAVETIPDGFFTQCTYLTSLTIGESIENLNAFIQCPNLITVNFKGKVIPPSMFMDCEKLSTVAFGDKLTTIGNGAFARCSNFTSITIGENVTSIGEAAFDGCSGLKVINFNAKAIETTLYEPIFGQGVGADGLTVTFGKDVTVIPDFMFATNDKITSVTISNNVTYAGNAAFSDCTKLKTAYVDSPIVSESMFSGCTELETLTIGENVTSIVDRAFLKCTGLKMINFNAKVMDSTTYDPIFGPGIGADGLEVIFGKDVTVIPNLMFSYNDKLTSVTISNKATIGEGVFNECVSLKTVNIDSTIIPDATFLWCTSLETLTIGENVTNISSSAFTGCEGLKTINFNAKAIEKTYYSPIFGEGIGADGLEVIFGKDVTVIPDMMFLGNKKITHITIGDNMTIVGQGAFMECPNLNVVTIDATTIDQNVFTGCISLETLTIGENVKTIGDGAFAGCEGLKTINFNAKAIDSFGREVFGGAGADDLEVIFGENVTVIPDMMFAGNEKIAHVTIGDKVTTVGNGVFVGCIGLKTADINSSSISQEMFVGCISLETLTIGENVTSVGSYAFAGCEGLKTINFNAKAIDSFGSDVFGGAGADDLEVIFGENVTVIPDMMFAGNEKIAHVTIGDKVTTVGVNAFVNCIGLKTVDINSSSISQEMFVGCISLETLTIGENVKTVGTGAFIGCVKLTTLTLGKNITMIGENAFYECTGLNTIIFNGNNVEFIGNLAFGQCPNIKNVKFISFPDDVIVGSNVFSYESEETNDTVDYIFKNVGIKDDFVFNEDNAKNGIFDNRSYEFKSQGILVTHAVITFDPNGGACSVKDLVTDETGKIIKEIPTPIRNVFTFEGWYIGDTKITEDTVFTEDTTVVAKWTFSPHTITYYANGGSCDVESVKTDTEGRINGTIPTPTREGFTFDGWYCNGELVTQDTVFYQNSVVSAQWTAVPGPAPSGDDGNGFNWILLIVFVIAILFALYVAVISRRRTD